MKHYGNISNIRGYDVPIVDLVTGGSPCQDLSVAGKRAGMKHEGSGHDETTRSGLFMEQIRIVKEMRENDRRTNERADKHIRPRYMVWENVPGAFSSNKGKDFQAVLEETAKIADEGAIIPEPPKGKWRNSGSVMGDGWSIAWRVFDAQFWGVPQRRRRIYLVADFGGHTAPEILFKRESLPRDIEKSREQGQGTSADTKGCTAEAVGFDSYNQVTYAECSQTLKAEQGGDSVAKVVVSKACYQNGQGDCFENDVTCALATNSNPSGRNVPLITESVCKPINTQVITRHNALGERTGFGLGKDGDPAYTIQAGAEGAVPTICFDPRSQDGAVDGVAFTQHVFENHSQDTRYVGPLEVAQTVSATYGMGGNNQPFVVNEVTAFTQNQREEVRVLGDKTGAISAEPGSHQQTYVLNDQGGQVMDVSDISATLRAEAHGNQPIVFEPGIASRDGGHCYEGVCGTLRANMGDNQFAVAIENHPADSRVNLDDSGTIQTLTSRMGTGGGNVPMTMVIRSGCEGGGKGPLIQEDLSATLATLATQNNQTLFEPKVYGICSKDSNSMKSDNPHSGCYEADTTRTLDQNGGNPACNQGGMMIVDNATFANDAYDKWTPSEIASTQRASGGVYGGGSETLITSQSVRRLTPLECERLQGFPDYWTNISGIENPTEEQIAEWQKVFDDYNKAIGNDVKPKTANQVKKWLKNPVSDSAQYKALGNSVAIPNVTYVLYGIAEQLGFQGTIGSLFDGIGGFPLVWERLCGKESALWASEIEPFPILVTKNRFYGE